MTVPRRALYGLIGPNGAGKTTVFNLLTGVYCPTEGEIQFDGTRIEKKKPYEITRLGAARTFQNIRLFADMTRARERDDGASSAHRARCCLMPCSAPRRHHREEKRDARAGDGAAEDLQSRQGRRRAGDQPALRQPAPARDRARAGHRAEAAAARRARGRHEPAGSRSS